MHEDIHQVVAVGPQLCEVIVQVAIGEHREWAVGFVALCSSDGTAPKIVLEDVPEGCFAWIQVVICQYAAMVVEHKPSIQRVHIGEERSCKNQQNSQRRSPHFRFLGVELLTKSTHAQLLTHVDKFRRR